MEAVFDWQALEEQLIKQSREAIRQFATEYPDVTCSFFAYDVNPIYGEFLVSFETAAHSLEQAQENEQEVIKRRNQMLALPEAWQHAKYFSTHPVVTEYSPDVGLFAHPIYASIQVSELDELSASGVYPKGTPTNDDYIEGNARIVLWKVIERLIASDAFSPLTLASPFRVGYQFHDEVLCVLRILNWPQLQQ
jgi:hypothetical protein